MATTKPTIGQSNWGVTLNAAIDQLDAADATNAAGIATNTTAIAANASAISGNTTAIAGKVAKGELVFNAKDYGALGDGTTDDRTAIANALTAAGAGTAFGPTVVFLPYTSTGYIAASAFSIPAGVTLRGERRVLVKRTGTTSVTFINLAGDYARLENVSVDVNGLASSRAVFANTNVLETAVVNCAFTDSGGVAGVGAVETTNGVEGLTVSGCLFDGIDNPVFINKDPKRVRITGNRLKNWKTRGIYVLGTSTLATTDLVIEDNYITDMVTGASTPRHPIQIVGNVALRHSRVRVNKNVVIGPNKSYNAVDPGTADQISLHLIDQLQVNDNISIYGGDVGITISQTCSNVTVKGNIVMFNDTVGIYVGSDVGVPLKDFTITGNVCKNNGQNRNSDRTAPYRCGVMVDAYAQQGVVSGNALGDDQGTKTQQYGVTCASATDTVLGANADGGNAVALYFLTGTNTNVTQVPTTTVNAGVAAQTNVQAFTANGTWTKPAGAQAVMVALVAGGGGGGSGRRGAAASVRCGGGGGAGGGLARAALPASSLTSTVAVGVGAAGTAGAAVTADSTDGNAGGAGGTSSFGSYLRTLGGGAGSGGTNATGAAGAANASCMFVGGAGAAASTTGNTGSNAAASIAGAPGGGSAGGVMSTDTQTAGGTGGTAAAYTTSGGSAAGGTAGGGAGGAGTAPPTSSGIPGGGGGGGGGNIGGAGGAGGAGAIGGGGGGGGASLNGANSGAGGAGGIGFVLVVTTF